MILLVAAKSGESFGERRVNFLQMPTEFGGREIGAAINDNHEFQHVFLSPLRGGFRFFFSRGLRPFDCAQGGRRAAFFCASRLEDDLGVLDHSRQQQRAAGQLGEEDMLVPGVCSLTNGAQAVESRDADAGGEVSIRASTDGSFFELPADLVGDGLRLLVERGDTGGALHGQAVDAAVDVQFAMLVEGLKGAHFSVKAGGLFGTFDADVDFGDGFGGNDVGARASANDAGIDGNSLLQVIEFRNYGNLAGEFEDGAVSFAGVEAGVGGDAFYRQGVIANTLARGLDGAALAGGGLEHEHGGGFASERFGDGPRRAAADFLVGNQKNGDRPGQPAVPGLESFDGKDHQRDAGLHVESAGAMQAAIGDATRHVSQSAQRINRIEMAKQENGLVSRVAGEIDLHVVGVFVGAVNPGTSAEGFESGGEQCAHAVAGEFAVAGRLDLDKFADRLDERVVARLEILQALAPEIGFGFFPGWHVSHDT